MDNEKGTRENGSSPSGAAPTPLSFNREIYCFIQHYRTKLYPEYYGHEHPYLKREQMQRVHDALYAFAIEHDWLGVTIGDVETPNAIELFEEMARSFFERVGSNDHNINHFTSGNMLDVRFYDSGLY